MMMVVPLRGFLIHDNARYARCVNFPPIPRVQRNVRNVFLLKEKAAAIFFFSADYTEHPPAAAAQCCHFQISNKTYIHQRSCLLCHPCPSDDSSGNQTYRIWGQPLCCFQANAFCEAQARVRQGSARDGSQGERPQSLNPCLELTLTPSCRELIFPIQSVTKHIFGLVGDKLRHF